MLNSLKISLVIIPMAILIVIGTYTYSLWASERQREAELPIEAADVMMRDLLAFHKKRGGFPKDLKEMEGVVWEKKGRDFSIENRALTHRNYYYFYTRIDHHHFTLWAIPVGKSRDEGPTWFLSVSPDSGRRWKGGALPLEQIDRVDANPSLKELGTLGLIEQPQVDLQSREKAGGLSVSRPILPFGAGK